MASSTVAPSGSNKDGAASAPVWNHIAFLYAGPPEPGPDVFEDGEQLVKTCLDQVANLNDPDWFPPRLFILLAAPPYLKPGVANLLLAGIQQSLALNQLDDVPLIGSTVSAVFFNEQIYENGAALICLASRFSEATVGVAHAVADSPETKICKLVRSQGHDPHLLRHL